METSIHQSFQASTYKPLTHPNPLKSFINWADKQEENRLTWTAIAVAGHGCVFTIATVMCILLTGNSFIFWPFAIGAMAMCLVVNLAAMPTKVTIPVLFLSVVIDVVIIVAALSSGLDLAASYR